MKPEKPEFLIRSKNPPIVEIDSEAMAIYVRFSDLEVARTIGIPSDEATIAMDLDKNGEVIGIEAVGFNSVAIAKLLDLASVQAPDVDFSRAELRPTFCPA